MQKEVNRLCMLSARKDVTMDHNKLAADVAFNELRLDKEASDTYHQQVLQLLQQDVEKGISTEEDLQQEIQAMKALETKHKNSKQAQAHICGGLHRQHGWCGPQRSDDIVHAHAPQDHHAVEKTGLPLPDPHHHTGPVSVPEAEKSATEETGDAGKLCHLSVLRPGTTFNWMKLPLTWKEQQPLLVMMWINSHVASSASWRNDLTISIATFAMQRTKHTVQPESAEKEAVKSQGIKTHHSQQLFATSIKLPTFLAACISDTFA